jgi:hypothetical protein
MPSTTVGFGGDVGERARDQRDADQAERQERAERPSRASAVAEPLAVDRCRGCHRSFPSFGRLPATPRRRDRDVARLGEARLPSVQRLAAVVVPAHGVEQPAALGRLRVDRHRLLLLARVQADQLHERLDAHRVHEHVDGYFGGGHSGCSSAIFAFTSGRRRHFVQKCTSGALPYLQPRGMLL